MHYLSVMQILEQKPVKQVFVIQFIQPVEQVQFVQTTQQLVPQKVIDYHNFVDENINHLLHNTP